MKFDIKFSPDNSTALTINLNVHVSGKLDHYHHYDALVKSINQLGERAMALSQDLKDLTAKIDDATNKVAARIDALIGKITNSMTDQEVAEVKAGLQAESDKLTALGADPVNPIPQP